MDLDWSRFILKMKSRLPLKSITLDLYLEEEEGILVTSNQMCLSYIYIYLSQTHTHTHICLFDSFLKHLFKNYFKNSDSGATPEILLNWLGLTWASG